MLRLLNKRIFKSLDLKFNHVIILVLLFYIFSNGKENNIIFEDSNGRPAQIRYQNDFESGSLIYKIIQKGDVLILYTNNKEAPIRIFNVNELFFISMTN